MGFPLGFRVELRVCLHDGSGVRRELLVTSDTVRFDGVLDGGLRYWGLGLRVEGSGFTILGYLVGVHANGGVPPRTNAFSFERVLPFLITQLSEQMAGEQ